MALPATAVRGVVRSGSSSCCRQWVLRSFIASIGGPSITSPPQTLQRRTFAAPSTRRSDQARERTQQAENDDHPLNDINVDFARGHESQVKAHTLRNPEPGVDDAELETQKEESKTDESYVPWYLQVESPVAPRENTAFARQKIPETPEHSPELLEPLLQRVSIELGMDDLTLLDLREMNPPPALGANLFMIVGTARSEKHLHVSADKLCRWLRSEHRLTPFADGLLGRQELKVKMRRRAKKSKLLSAVGSKSNSSTELDEGIRTGWVCVNVGRIEGGELPQTEEEKEAENNFVGFGTRTTGCHVVVQLMTEEKRAEIDLETLWRDLLWRSKKTKLEHLKEALKEAEAAIGASETESKGDALDALVPSRPLSGVAYDPIMGNSPRETSRATA